MKKQSGNILFIILIAVALFAALSYAVMQSSRSGGNDVSAEKSEMFAAQIVRYGNSIETAITRMMVSNGCSDTELSFEHAPFDGSDASYLNPNSPADFSCHIFHPDGGGVANLEQQITDNFSTASIRYVGRTAINHIGTSDCVDDSCGELYMFLDMQDNSGTETCTALNTFLQNSDLVPTASTGSAFLSPTFQGAYTAGHQTSNSRLDGKHAFCHNYSSIPTRDFYIHVLLPR